MKKILTFCLAFAACASAQTRMIVADFEKGRDGFAEPLQQQTGKAASGQGFATIVNKDQRWVSTGKELDKFTHEPEALRFSVRSEDVQHLAVRFVDNSGQTFQQRVTFKSDGAWQTIRITDFTLGQNWGGANDKVWHSPPKNLGFILEHHGTVALDDVAFELSDKPFIPELGWEFPSTGHLFDTPAQVAIKILSQAPSIDWVVTDFWRNTAASGKLALKDGIATLRPGIQQQGYFLLKLTPNGDEAKARYVSFAVVPPFTPTNHDASPFGVMTHFAQHMSTDILPLLSRIGITSVRDEHYWAQVEKEKGVYTFSDKSNDYMADLKKSNLDPLIAMTFANPLHDAGKTPHTPAGCDAYGDYGQAILKQYGRQIKWLEIWNEYNGTWCDGPAASDRSKYYAQMLKHAYQKIKAVRPDVQVLGCATVLIPMPFIEGIFKHDGLKYMDGVVIHPYRGAPEGVEKEVADLEALIRQYNNGKPKPIWVTETGRHDTREAEWEKGKKLYEEGRQYVTRYLTRQYTLLMMSSNVEKIYWYLCRDYMEFVSMGLLRNVDDPMGRYAVAPAYVSYATLIRQLDGAKFVKRADLGRFTYALLFDTASGPVWVCWATQPATVGFKVNAARKVVDIMGVERTLTPVNGEVTLSLGEDVLFLRGNAEPSATPALNIAAEIRCPVLGQLGFDGGKNAAGMTLDINGGTTTLDATGRAALPAFDTTQPNSGTSHYQLQKGDALVAMGTLCHEVVESVVVLPSIQAESDQMVFAQLENRLPDAPAYQFRGVDWKLGNGKTFATRKNLALPAEHLLSMRFAGFDKKFEPYQRYDLELTAKFENRADVVAKGEVSYNPCYYTVDNFFIRIPSAIVMSKHAQHWGATGNDKEEVCIGYNEKDLILAFSWVYRPLYIGIASSDNTVWHILSNKSDVTFAGVYSSGAPLLPERGWEIYNGSAAPCNFVLKIPWSQLHLPTPQHGNTFRLAVAFADNKSWHEWGTGLLMGRTPAGFNVCRFVDPNAKTTNETHDFVLEPIQQKTAKPLEPGRVLADSEADYTKEQGGNRHYYGYYAAKQYSADAFVEMQHVQTIWGYNWGPRESGFPHMSLSASGAHPGARDGLPVWVVRRWKSDYTGKVKITGTVRANDTKSDGVGLRVLVDGIQAAAILAGGKNYPQEAAFDFDVDVNVDSLVDFAFTPGPAASVDYDATTYTFKIRELK